MGVIDILEMEKFCILLAALFVILHIQEKENQTLGMFSVHRQILIQGFFLFFIVFSVNLGAFIIWSKHVWIY